MVEQTRSRVLEAGPALLLFGTVVAATHHVGLLTDPLGTVGSTSWNDWLDLLVPYLVIGSAVLVLLAAHPDPWAWGIALVGGIAYVEGHGLHLAANSIGNAAPGPTAHLWDEVVGHAIWFAGLGLLVVALVRALRDVPLVVSPVGWLIAVCFGVTVATNAFGGNTVAGSLPAALLLAAYGARRRDPLGHLLVVTFGVAALLVLGGLVVG